MLKTQTSFFLYFINNIIEPLQAGITPLCNILDVSAERKRWKSSELSKKTRGKKIRTSSHCCRRKKIIGEKMVLFFRCFPSGDEKKSD